MKSVLGKMLYFVFSHQFLKMNILRKSLKNSKAISLKEITPHTLLIMHFKKQALFQEMLL